MKSTCQNRTLLSLLAALTFQGICVAADSVNYSDVLGATGKVLTYGERITIRGEFKDFNQQISDCTNKPNECASEWLELSGLKTSYKVITGGTTSEEKNAPTTVNTATGLWMAQLEPLPADSSVEFTFQLEMIPRRGKLEELISSIVSLNEFEQANISLFNEFDNAKGDNTEQKKAINNFLNRTSALIFNRMQLPSPLRHPDISATSTDLSKIMTENVTAITNLRENLKDLGKTLGKEITSFHVSDALDAIQKSSSTDDEGLREAKAQFKSNWEKFKNAMNLYAKVVLKDQISVQLKVRTSITTSELERYAGIDVGAVFVPGIDEMRQFVTVNIYWGPVVDKPSNSLNPYQGRLSLTIGRDIGDISGNKDSDVKGDHAYSIGIGARLNKYFRISGGRLLYRSVATGKLENEGYLGLSVDLTAFKSFQTLVAK